MPDRDDQQMARADWESIPEGDDLSRTDGVSEDDPLVIELAERAEHREWYLTGNVLVLG